MLRYLVAFLLLASPALAQQQQVPTVAETAIEINNIIGQWSQRLVQQGKVIEELQKQIAVRDAKIKELEPKSEAPK